MTEHEDTQDIIDRLQAQVEALRADLIEVVNKHRDVAPALMVLTISGVAGQVAGLAVKDGILDTEEVFGAAQGTFTESFDMSLNNKERLH